VPVAGSRPTSGWQPGEVISGDAFALAVPADAAPGVYTVWLDLYPNGDPSTRLPVRASGFASTDGDKVKVVAVKVAPPGS